MLVRLKSAFYDGFTFWPIGVQDIPAEIGGRKVVFFDENKKAGAGEFVLPRTAESAEKLEAKPETGDKPMALSEIGNAKPQGFVEAMTKK